MEPYRKAFEKQVRQFLEESGCQLVTAEGRGRASAGKPAGPDLLVRCSGQVIGIRLDVLCDREAEPWRWDAAEFPDRYGILLSPDRFALFRNFIGCLLAGDMENAGHNYGLLRMGREEMARLVR